jgi:uncharacterized membrane protein YdjX (TVP38/TMEM64 family)
MPGTAHAAGGLRLVAFTRLLVLVAVVGFGFALAVLWVPHDPAELRGWVLELGTAGPLLFVAVVTVLTCALFPYPVLAATSGLLFGTAGGTAISIVAGTAGAVVAFVIARNWGAGPVDRLAGARLRRLLARVGRRGFVAVLYLRIVPGVPRGVANYAVGLTPVGLGAYTAATVIGIAPRAFAYTALGSSFAVGRLDSPEAVVAVVALVALAIFGALLLVRERRRTGDAA